MEIIVSDNASPNHLWFKIQRLADIDSRIIVRQNDVNLGWTGNLNECTKIARGKFILFLCDDDELLPGILKYESDYLKLNPTVGFVHTAAEIVGVTGKVSISRSHSPQLLKAGVEALTETALSFNITFSSVMVRKICFDKLGYFIENISADYEMWSRIASQYDIGYIDQPLVRFYIHTISNNMTVDRYISESEILFNIIQDYFPNNIKQNLELSYKFEKQLSDGLRSLGKQSFQIGDWKRGLSFFLSAKNKYYNYRIKDFIKDMIVAIKGRISFLFKRKNEYTTNV